MSSVSATPGAISTRRASGHWLSGDRWILWVHLGALALQAPLLSIYLRELWTQPHYAWFPFTLLFVGYYVWVRTEEFDRVVFGLRGFWANLFLVLAIPFVLFANLRFDPEFAGIGCFLIAASLLARTRDRSTGESLLPVVFALALMVRLPFGMDTRIITTLQRFTSQVASRVLDVMGIDHLLSGNVIHMPNQVFGVEEACGGIQSLFLLLFCALAWVAISRRGLIRSLLLIISAVLWAVICNSARVLTICAAHAWWGIDLAAGIPHVVVGYIFMFLAIGLLISTDFLLEFMFGRGEVLDGQTNRNRLSLILFGGRPKKAQQSGQGVVPSVLLRPIIFGVCLVFSLVAFVPVFAAGPLTIVRQLTRGYIAHEVTREALPETVEVEFQGRKIVWTRDEFVAEERDQNSEWGSRSAKWTLSTPGNRRDERLAMTISCDYPFFGWHELTGCYRGSGWTMQSRSVVTVEGVPDWPVVVARFSRPTGGHGLLLFSLFDERGRPASTMGEDILKMNVLQRAVATIRKRVTKDYGPLPQTYQVQIFHTSMGELGEADEEFLLKNYVQLREWLRRVAAPAGSERTPPQEGSGHESS